MLRKQIEHAEVRVEMDWFLRGSVVAGTVEAGASQCRSHFKVHSPEPLSEIANVVRLAKRGCFAEQLVQQPVPLVSTFELNGHTVDLDFS
jgi:hypothetical protein